MTRRAPILTGTLVAACLVAYMSSDIAGLLVYQRELVSGGEIWRLLGGNLVHFSPGHLLVDVTLFAILAGIIERMAGPGRLAILCLTIGLAISLLVPMLHPSMVSYGGLSGINYGLFVILCLSGAAVAQIRLISLLALVWVAANISLQATGYIGLMEGLSMGSLSATAPMDADIVIIWEAHLVGCVTALVIHSLSHWVGNPGWLRSDQDASQFLKQIACNPANFPYAG